MSGSIDTETLTATDEERGWIDHSCSLILERGSELEPICLVVLLVKRTFVHIEIRDNQIGDLSLRWDAPLGFLSFLF